VSKISRIVLLSGAGSAGKTSIAGFCSRLSCSPICMCKWIHLFMAMLPERHQNDPEGFSYEVVFEENRPLVVIKTGPVGERALRGMRHAIRCHGRGRQ
jgi:chloramphenicol 3-O phosphotransferase